MPDLRELTITKVPSLIENNTEEDKLMSDMAMDIGKQVAHHIKTMYPEAVVSSSFLVSVRNCTYNEIMAAIKVNEEGEIIRRITKRKERRRTETKLFKKMREDY